MGGNDPSVSLRHCIQVYVERSNLKIIGSGKDLIEKKMKAINNVQYHGASNISY